MPHNSIIKKFIVSIFYYNETFGNLPVLLKSPIMAWCDKPVNAPESERTKDFL